MIAADGARSTLRRLHGPRLRGPRVPGPVPDLRHQDADGAAGRALVLVRPALQPRPLGPAAPAGRRRVAARFPGRRRGRPRRGDQARERRPARAGHAGRGHRLHASNGSASTASSRGGCRSSATGACCLPAMPRTRCRRSARAAATAACRTPTTSPGSSTWCCAGWRRSGCSTATRPSACRPRTRTCAITTRSTDFIAPKSAMSRTFRDGVLALAETEPFARRLVNSGRLSVADLLRALAAQRAGRIAPANARPCGPALRRSTRRLATAGCSISWMDGFQAILLQPRRFVFRDAFRSVQADLASRDRLAKFAIVSRETSCARYGAERDPALLPVPPRPARCRALAELSAGALSRQRSIGPCANSDLRMRGAPCI